jgi:catechol 2,3-dioxygenase-like lactoylglutathione lyase family enzyme
VDDAAAAAAYYTRVFGLRPLWTETTSAHTTVGLGFSESDAELVLHTDAGIPHRVEVHYLVDDVVTAVEQLRREGCAVAVPPFAIAIGRCAVVRDPFGTTLCMLDMTRGPRVLGDAAVTGDKELAVSTQGVRGFDHVAIPTAQPEAMMEFYGALGFEVPDEHHWREVPNPRLTIVCGDQKINLHPPAQWQDPGFTLRAPAARPGCGDFCFVWQGPLEALLAALRRAGAAVEAGPVERVGGRDHGQARGTSVYTRDPDGNLLEFIVYER